MSALYPTDPAECLTPRSIKEAREIARAIGRESPAGDWLDMDAPLSPRWDALAAAFAVVCAVACFIFIP